MVIMLMKRFNVELFGKFLKNTHEGRSKFSRKNIKVVFMILKLFEVYKNAASAQS